MADAIQKPCENRHKQAQVRQSFCQLFRFICIYCIYIYIYIISHTDIKEGLQSPASKFFFHFTISFTIGPCIFGEVDIN